MKGRKKIINRDTLYLLIVGTFLVLFTICVLYPLIYVVSCSFSDAKALIQGRVFFLPVDFSLDGYKAVFNYSDVWQGYGNTIIYTIIGTIIGTIVTLIGAYVLSRKEFPIRNLLTKIFMFTMFFGGGTIPTYLLLRKLHMLNTMWAIVLPGACSVYLIIIGRTFIQSSIPEELFEATCLDGGDYIQYFVKVIIPLAKPIIAVVALNFALTHWNSYYSALLYLSDSDKYPLQIVLRQILVQNTIDFSNQNNLVSVTSAMQSQYLSELLKYALIVVSSLPLLCIYPFIQKYFIKGVMIGSVKG